LWGGTPEHVHDFITGQQARIHEAQGIEKTCEQLERERDEAREDLKFRRGFYKVQEQYLKTAMRERDEARADAAQLADRLSGLELRTTEELARLEQELDAAREALEHIVWFRTLHNRGIGEDGTRARRGETNDT
jgi:hypothetical protein